MQIENLLGRSNTRVTGRHLTQRQHGAVYLELPRMQP